MRDLPRRARIFLLAVVLAAAALVVLLVHRDGASKDLLGFALLFLVAELFPFRIRDAFYSVSYVVTVAAIVAVGPGAAAIAATFVGAASLTVHPPREWISRVGFNSAQFALATGISGAAYVGVGGPVGHLSAHDFPGVLLALAVASLVFFFTNTLLVTTMISFVRSKPMREIFHANYSSMVGSTLSFGLVGIFLAALYFQIGIWAPLFVLVPLLVARRVLQATGEMDKAYEATLRGLVTAIEAKDAYTRGHAERVSKLTTMIARELGFSEKQVHSVRIAALMHDVGKLVVSTAILTKPGKLTDEEYEHMKWHPIFGCEVIEEIDFLRDGEAVNAVRHHHERLDGRGYPDNLFGDDVPLTARVVMVADAFDSMTSTRTYRFAKNVDDGMRELRRCAATQFDPLCISALDRAIHKHGWEPTPELYGGEQTERPAVSVHAKHA
jgi:HD-GYP domain-containing protein (c-di-GMP phosphodiesterase class II)